MSLRNTPPARGEPISAEFLQELGGLAGRPIEGPGVSATQHGVSIAGNFMQWPVVFELQSALSATTHTAKAYPVGWTPSGDWATRYDVPILITVEDGTGTITASAGAVGWGMWGFTGTVLIAYISDQSPLTQFQLTSTKTPGSSASADIINDDGSTGDEITVTDQTNGRQFRALSGARGFARKVGDDYLIVNMKEKARMIKGSGPGTTVAASASFTLSSITVLDDGDSPGSSVTATNWASQLPASATGIVCVSDGSGGYLVIDGPCPPAS